MTSHKSLTWRVLLVCCLLLVIVWRFFPSRDLSNQLAEPAPPSMDQDIFTSVPCNAPDELSQYPSKFFGGDHAALIGDKVTGLSHVLVRAADGEAQYLTIVDCTADGQRSSEELVLYNQKGRIIDRKPIGESIGTPDANSIALTSDGNNAVVTWTAGADGDPSCCGSTRVTTLISTQSENIVFRTSDVSTSLQGISALTMGINTSTKPYAELVRDDIRPEGPIEKLRSLKTRFGLLVPIGCYGVDAVSAIPNGKLQNILNSLVERDGWSAFGTTPRFCIVRVGLASEVLVGLNRNDAQRLWNVFFLTNLAPRQADEV